MLYCSCVFFVCFFLMLRRPPRSTRTDTLFPYTTLFRSLKAIVGVAQVVAARRAALAGHAIADERIAAGVGARRGAAECARLLRAQEGIVAVDRIDLALEQGRRSEEHTSELQSLLRISYAVCCLKQKKQIIKTTLCIQIA